MSTVGELLIRKTAEIVEHERFETDPSMQVEIVYPIIKEWDTLTKDTQEKLKLILGKSVRRLSEAPNPSVAMDQLVELNRVNPRGGKFEILDSLSSVYYKDTPYYPDPDHDLFPKTGWIGKYLEYAKHSEVPTAFHFWSAITILGAACKYRVAIQNGPQKLRLNWYTLLSANKSVGKSLAKDIGVDIVKRANRYVAKEVVGGAGALIAPTGAGPGPGEIRIIGEDSTKESIITEMASSTTVVSAEDGSLKIESTDSTALMAIDELANFLGKSSFGADTKIPFLTSIYSGDYTKSTKGGGKEVLRNCALSMLACCAPSWLVDSIEPIMFTGGFLDRFRIVHRGPDHSPRTYPFMPVPDPVLANLLAQQLVPWMTLSEDYIIKLSDESQRWYANWYTRTKAKFLESPEEGLTLHRLGNQVIRLGGGLCISDGSAPLIETHHLRNALQILEYDEGGFRSLVEVIHESPEVKQVKQIFEILTSKDFNAVINYKDLHIKLRRKKGFTPWKPTGMRYIEQMIDAGHLVITKMPQGGTKPIRFYSLTDIGLEYLSDSGVNDKVINRLKTGLNSHCSHLPDDEKRRIYTKAKASGGPSRKASLA